MKIAHKYTHSLKTKTFLGFVELIVMLGLFLFVPAGTFIFWQAWIYSIIFFVSSATVTFYLWKRDPQLLARRSKVGPVEEKEKSQKVIQLLASLLFTLILAIPGFDHRFGWSHIPVYIVILGDILVILGFYFIFLVLKENTFASSTIEISTNQKVISTGPYSLIRHPMYSGALVMLFGTPLALGSWWGLLMLIPFTLILILRLLDEEKFLSKNLPGYNEYCQKVRYRLIPSLW